VLNLPPSSKSLINGLITPQFRKKRREIHPFPERPFSGAGQKACRWVQRREFDVTWTLGVGYSARYCAGGDAAARRPCYENCQASLVNVSFFFL
jgi:hypothetical protein